MVHWLIYTLLAMACVGFAMASNNRFARGCGFVAGMFFLAAARRTRWRS